MMHVVFPLSQQQRLLDREYFHSRIPLRCPLSGGTRPSQVRHLLFLLHGEQEYVKSVEQGVAKFNLQGAWKIQTAELFEDANSTKKLLGKILLVCRSWAEQLTNVNVVLILLLCILDERKRGLFPSSKMEICLRRMLTCFQNIGVCSAANESIHYVYLNFFIF